MKHVVPLIRLRATYMVQLLVTVCESSAKSFANLFKNLHSQDVLRSLADLDCCIIRADVFNDVWASVLYELNTSSTFDMGAILKKHDVKALTASAKSRLGLVTGSAGDEVEGTETPDHQTIFAINDLLQFTACEDVLPSDQNWALMQHMQMALLEQARPCGKQN